MLDKVFDWFVKRPWVMQALVGLVWIMMAIVCVGKGEDYGVFVAFMGMLWWATLEKDNQELRHDLRRALDGWTSSINLANEALSRGRNVH